ncbi:hypothetical protein MBLNU13_g06767t2 [Cladosporium sp. NU13]
MYPHDDLPGPLRQDPQHTDNAPQPAVVCSRPWQTGSPKHTPWAGLLALLAGFLFAAAAIWIPYHFDDKPLDHWQLGGYTVQPSVLISTFTSLSNKGCLPFAFGAGIAIFWWTSALHGTELRELQASYQRSTSLMGLLHRQPVINRVTCASVLTLSLLAFGPILQRSISVVVREKHTNADVIVPISSSPLMTGSTGIFMMYSPVPNPTMFNPMFSEILKQYNARENITLPDLGCRGSCTIDIEAAGWDVQCSTGTSTYELMTNDDYLQWQKNVTEHRPWTGPPQSQVMFDTNVTYAHFQAPFKFGQSFTDQGVNYQLVLSTKYKATQGARGNFSSRRCTLSEALVRYRVKIIDQALIISTLQVLDSPAQTIWRRGESHTLGTNTPSTLGGFWLALRDYQTSVRMSSYGSWYSIDTNSTTASMYLHIHNASSLQTFDVTWKDPTDDMISKLNELIFRLAVATSSQGISSPISGKTADPAGRDERVLSPSLASSNRTTQQQASMSMVYEHTVYSVQYRWLVAALVLILLVCFSILWTYLGWWELGRPVSLDPLETAKAFDAALLHRADMNGTASEICEAVGTMRVRYGFVSPSADWQHAEDIEMQSMSGSMPRRPLSPRNPACDKRRGYLRQSSSRRIIVFDILRRRSDDGYNDHGSCDVFSSPAPQVS